MVKGRRIPQAIIDHAVSMYDSGIKVATILSENHIDSKTLYKYLRLATPKRSLRKPWFCNHHPKKSKSKGDTL